jgi:uncharacterized membrane protein YkoI
MHTRQIKLNLVTLALVSGLAFAAYAGEDKGEKMSLADLPDAAQKTVNEQTAGGKIEQIKQENEKGQTRYEVKFTKGDKKMEIEVGADGKVLVTEEEVALDQSPAAVQKTIKAEAGDGTVKKVMKTMEDGKEHFGVVVMGKDDKKQWFEVAADGTLMPKEKDEADEEHEKHGEHHEKGEHQDKD